MRSIIESVYRRVGRDNLFGWKHGLTMWSQGKKALDAEIGIPTWKHHDLRRSTATHLAELGTPPHIVETILNHQSGHKGGVAGIYNKSIYPQEVRTALTMWSDRMNEIIRLSADDEVFEADIVQALKRAE
jgi:integrase